MAKPSVYASRSRRLFVEAPIDPGDLLHPLLALLMLERQDLFMWPVEMIGNVRYLLVEPR
jgi:hypothetical protein